MQKLLYKSFPINIATIKNSGMEVPKLKYQQHKDLYEVGEWYKVDSVRAGEKGFFASEKAFDIINFAEPTGMLALVEVKGNHETLNYKIGPNQYVDIEFWESMRIVKKYDWAFRDSTELALLVAKLVVSNCEPKQEELYAIIPILEKAVESPTLTNRQEAEKCALKASSIVAKNPTINKVSRAAKTVEFAAQSICGYLVFRNALNAMLCAGHTYFEDFEKYIHNRIKF